MKLAFELGFLAIILVAIWGGYKKGLIMGIGSVVVLIASVFIGSTLSSAYSQDVLPAMTPFASGYVNSLVKDGIYEELAIETSEYSYADLLEQNPDIKGDVATGTFLKLGIHAETAETMSAEALAYQAEESEELGDSITYVLCSKVAFAIGFVIFALLALIVLTVLGNILNFSYRIPYFGIGNEVGGAVMGLASGVLLCMALGWVLRFTGIIMPDGLLESTVLADFFMNHNLLANFLGM